MQPSQSNRPENNDLRVIVVAPTGRDARLICDLLTGAGIACFVSNSCVDACGEVNKGAGAVIVAEEALNGESIENLKRLIETQPSWSDFPLILLTIAGVVSSRSERRSAMRAPLGNVLLLERPIRPETLISTVESALRARRRQYEIRAFLHTAKQAEEALRRSEKLAVAGRMAASIAHEINNPLEAVTNLLYLATRSGSLEEVRRFVTFAQEEVKRVAEITTQTLKFYRQPTTPAPVNLDEVLDSVLLLYHARLVSIGITVERKCEATRPIIGFGGELRQVFANLINNAIDAMPNGGTLKIRVRNIGSVHGGGGGLRVIVADTGTGVLPEIRAKIFEPFVSTKPMTGTGLGLWVTSEIIRRHGGTVRLKSKVAPGSSGTVFAIFLPHDQAALEPTSPDLALEVHY